MDPKAHKGSERRDLFNPQPDPPGKEKEKLKRALKVFGEGDDTDEDDVPPGPDFPDADGDDVIVRKEKVKRGLKEARGLPPVAPLPDIIIDTVPLDVIEPDTPLDVPDDIDDDPDIEA
jgi:hypothetical protein